MKTKLLKKLRKEHQITYIPSLKKYEVSYPHGLDVIFYTAHSYKNAKRIYIGLWSSIL